MFFNIYFIENIYNKNNTNKSKRSQSPSLNIQFIGFNLGKEWLDSH